MEVILRENVTSLGAVGDIVKVKTGYATNYLLPKRLAYQATEINKKRLESERAKLEAKQASQRGEAEGLKAQIEALELTITKEAGEEDRLYGSVTSHDVELALKEAGLEIDRKKISFADAIRSLGDYSVSVQLHAGVSANCRIKVASA